MTHNTVSSFRYLIALLVVVALLAGTASAKGPDNKEGVAPLAKTAGTPAMTILNINNVASFFRSDGQGNHDPADQSGFFYPKGTTTAIYEDGFVWGGKMYKEAAHLTAPTQVIRIGGQTYNQGTRAGKVNGSGASAVAVLAGDARSRVYRVRRDYASMTENEVRTDAATLAEITENAVTADQMASIRSQYATDWTNWPVDLGAPYIERNGTPGYQAPPAFSETFTVDNLISGKYDEPGVAGADPNSPADQVIWTVYNDLDPIASNGLYFSDPIGLEGQVTMWGYKRTDALGNLYFKRLKLINKGGVDVGGGVKGSWYVDSMYVSQWSDPDLGDAGDDICGCDTTLSLGFVYNGNAVDNNYKKYGLAPAAAGYDFLQGPIVPGGAGDSAIFNLHRVYGKKNLPMTGFIYFSAGSPISDPALANRAGASYESSLQWWRMLRGYRPDLSSVPERRYPFPPGVTPGPFTLTGDPTTQSGFVDGVGTDFSFPPGDRRIILTSGPFQMAPGDTQEVVMGTVAGLGSDRLSSVAIMKFNDGFVQNTYNALFAVPKAPPTPALKFTELDGKVVLEWGSDLTSVNNIENTVNMPGNYGFEGYNVYQLESKNSSLTAAKTKRLATYDLTSDSAVVLDLQFDAVSGKILQKAVQFGSNSGITRFFVLDRDYVRDVPRLNNGTEYYVAVTAYSASSTGYLPASLESPPNVYAVIPQPPKPGYSYSAKSGDDKTITHSTGIGDAKMYLKVVDPGQLKGASYTAGFYTKPDRFSVDVLNQGTDVNDVAFTIYELTSHYKVLNEAQSQMSYDLKLTNLDSLSGPVTAAVLQLGPADANGIPTGAVIKNIPVAVTLVSGVRFLTGAGTWTATDATQPLTKAFIDSMAAGKVYLSLRTSTNPTGEVAGKLGVESFPWYLDRGTTRLLAYQQNYSYDPDAVVPDNTYAITDGFQFKIGGLTFSAPRFIGGWNQLVKVKTTTPGFLPPSGGTGGYSIFSGITSDLASEAFGSGSAVTQEDLVQDLEFRFTGVRALRQDGTAPEDTVIVSGGSIASVYNSGRSIVKRLRIPFELWENDANGRRRQINVAVRDRNADSKSPWGNAGTPLWFRILGGRAYIEAIATAYDADTAAANVTSKGLMFTANPKGTWAIVPRYAPATSGAATSHWDTGDIVQLKFANTMTPGSDTYTWTTPTAQQYDASNAKNDVGRVNVFPNPYYAYNPLELSRTTRFVTFNGLPPQATIRIFNLAGQLVRTLRKDDATQFARWDLANQDNFPVASGMYIVHVDMPGIGATKVVKLAIIQEQEVPNNF